MKQVVGIVSCAQHVITDVHISYDMYSSHYAITRDDVPSIDNPHKACMVRMAKVSRQGKAVEQLVFVY